MSDGAIPSWPLPLARPPRIVVLACVRQTAGTERRRMRWRQPDGQWGLALMHGHGSIADPDGRWRRELRPGSVCATPPGTVVDLAFEPNCLQWEVRFIPIGRSGVVGLPAVVDPGPESPALERALRQAIAIAPGDPLRASAAVWHLLHEVAALGRRTDAASGTAAILDAALAALAGHPTGQPAVAWLAAQVGRSPISLGRIFREHLGVSPSQYLAMQRCARIRDLLVGTTLPLAEVAAMVGLHDLQHFNKFVRRALGAAPRRIRAQAVG
ncbi:MAG: AraC family transcriptional regulator [Planctomycetes bacterium]|nr:AraC family transcriptional regulator [Planctomycetota bacterium]